MLDDNILSRQNFVLAKVYDNKCKRYEHPCFTGSLYVGVNRIHATSRLGLYIANQVTSTETYRYQTFYWMLDDKLKLEEFLNEDRTHFPLHWGQKYHGNKCDRGSIENVLFGL